VSLLLPLIVSFYSSEKSCPGQCSFFLIIAFLQSTQDT
jgi:hypothetical protein